MQESGFALLEATRCKLSLNMGTTRLTSHTMLALNLMHDCKNMSCLSRFLMLLAAVAKGRLPASLLLVQSAMNCERGAMLLSLFHVCRCSLKFCY